MRSGDSPAVALRVIPATLVALSSVVTLAAATPVQNALTLRDVDWTWAATSGVGGACGLGGSTTLNLSGVNGPITHAFLYWHGVDALGLCDENARLGGDRAHALTTRNAPTMGTTCDGVYDNPTVDFNGTPVTGVPLGDATTNCWGEGSSRAYRADVTALVGGNGKYTLAGVSHQACDDLNGASLIVTFRDGDVTNDRDLVFFEGNDSNAAEAFPGETDGWHATLPGVHYTGGTATVQLHVADGQRFDASGLDDGDLTLSTGDTPLVVGDALHRYDGDSVPGRSYSRSERFGLPGRLWDVHSFDIQVLFSGENTYTLQMDGMDETNDCLGLVLLLVDLQAGSSPVPAGQRSWGSLKAIYR